MEHAKEAGALQQPLLPPSAMDWRGRPAHDHLGGWKCAYCILGASMLCYVAVYGVLFNLVIFLTQNGESNAAAAATVATVGGTHFLCSFLGAFLSDAFLGRFWASLIFQVLSTKVYQAWVDQVDSKDNEMYFQLVVVAILVSQLLAATVVTYIDNAGMWVWGLGLCVVTSLSSLMLFAGSLRWIRYRQVSGNPFLRNTQVLVAALRKHRLAVPKDSALLHEYKEDVSAIPGCRKLHHTCTLSFLDKAAVLEVADTSSCWRLCTVTQVEELKSFLRVIPAGISLAFGKALALVLRTCKAHTYSKGEPSFCAWYFSYWQYNCDGDICTHGVASLKCCTSGETNFSLMDHATDCAPWGRFKLFNAI
ncbi:hypothetical protein GOP47_0013519 [Adiantum capillus-veneris]|uniref:Uncharacterized protein n=1 Tax=Adiantum capillus-veneris TaxID=13818 RepID=A0A9D4UPX8_ADICA|nr:hypothetical protein GOP47_0013519 [Adiantum capillus-veneris]